MRRPIWVLGVYASRYVLAHLCLFESLFAHVKNFSHDHCSPSINPLPKVGEKESIMSQSILDRAISPSDEEFKPGTWHVSFLVQIPTPRVRFPYPAWTLMMHSYFSHLCLYETGFLSMWETSVSHDHVTGPLVLGRIHFKVGEKASVMSQSMQDRGISHSR